MSLKGHLKRFVLFTVMITKLSQKFEYCNKHHLYLHMIKKKRIFQRVTIHFATNSMLAEIPYPYYDLFRSTNYEKGNILFVYMYIYIREGGKKALRCKTQYYTAIDIL